MTVNSYRMTAPLNEKKKLILLAFEKIIIFHHTHTQPLPWMAITLKPQTSPKMSITNSAILDCQGFMADVIEVHEQCIDLKSDLHIKEEGRKEVFGHLKFILHEVLQLKKQIRRNKATGSKLETRLGT